MTYHAQINWIMLATVVGLISLLYFKPPSQDQDVQEYPLSSLSPEVAHDIRIVRNDMEIVLKKTDNLWHLITPLQVSADEHKINQILEILSLKSMRRFPLKDLEQFGLNKPSVQLYINQERFNFGGLSPITNQQYMATAEYAYLISPRYAILLPAHAHDLIISQK